MVIPGVGTLRPEDWKEDGGEIWLKTIRPDSAPDAGIFAFENELLEDGIFRWSQVENQGAAFLGALCRLIQTNDVGVPAPSRDGELMADKVHLILKLGHCPLVIFAHSTGGIILKRVSYITNPIV